MNSGPQECWKAGAQERWTTGTLELWTKGTHELWTTGTLERLNTGALELNTGTLDNRNTRTLDNRNTGTLDHRNTVTIDLRNTGTLNHRNTEHWISGPQERWNSGQQERWNSGPQERCNSIHVGHMSAEAMEAIEEDQGRRKLKTKPPKQQTIRNTGLAGEKSKKKSKKKEKSDHKKRGHTSSTPSTSDETDKHRNKNAKNQALIPASSHLQKSTDDSNLKKENVNGESKEISTSSASNTSVLQEGLVKESLRWEGVLEDPVAEEERICQYKINRRKRYMLAAQQNAGIAPDFSKKLPNQKHDTHTPLVANHDLPIKRDYSNSYFLGHKGQDPLHTKPGQQESELKLPVLVKNSL
ncbi:protein LIAT1 [Discoglossus pictus]